MVQVKKMNESAFAKLHKEFTSQGELIRARQEEKQGVLDEFDAECRRFFFGAISEKALVSSIKKTNKELQRLDKQLRAAIQATKSLGERGVAMAVAQKPIVYRATLSGLVGGSIGKKKKASRKKASKKSKKKSSKKKKRR